MFFLQLNSKCWVCAKLRAGGPISSEGSGWGEVQSPLADGNRVQIVTLRRVLEAELVSLQGSVQRQAHPWH